MESLEPLTAGHLSRSTDQRRIDPAAEKCPQRNVAFSLPAYIARLYRCGAPSTARRGPPEFPRHYNVERRPPLARLLELSEQRLG
jgi:hypothetical protein